MSTVFSSLSSNLFKKSIPLYASTSINTIPFCKIPNKKSAMAHYGSQTSSFRVPGLAHDPTYIPGKSAPEIPTAPPTHMPGISPEMSQRHNIPPEKPEVPNPEFPGPPDPIPPEPEVPSPEFPGPPDPIPPKPELPSPEFPGPPELIPPRPEVPGPPGGPKVVPPHGPDIVTLTTPEPSPPNPSPPGLVFYW